MNIDNIVFPQQDHSGSLIVDASYSLPVVVTDSYNFDEKDHGAMEVMKAIPPQSRLRAGDLARLTIVPSHMRRRFSAEGLAIPRVWKIRHVLSRWSLEVYNMYRNGEVIYGIDHAANMLELDGVALKDFTRTLIYAHGYPHGHYPNTASWFDSYMLQKLVIREMNEIWPEILDESDTMFTGYDPHCGHLHLDLAPDLYALGKNIKRPFRHEEPATHTAASLGLEELMMVPMSVKTPGIQRLKHEEDAYDLSSSSSSGPATIHTATPKIIKPMKKKLITSSPWQV